MIDRAQAEVALEAVRDLVAADGGDLRMVDVGPDSTRLELVLETAECAECVMPRAFLETVALDMMKPALPALRSVTIHDPRESEPA